MNLSELILPFRVDTNVGSFNNAQNNIRELDAAGAAASSNLLGGFTKITGALAAIGAASHALVGTWISDFQAIGDSTAKFARRVGVSVEKVQQLDYAASQSGVSVEAARMAQEKLGLQLGKNDKAFAEILGSIGLTSESLKKVDAGDRFTLVAEKLEKVTDNTKRAEVLVGLFGKSGAQMGNLFESGAKGIKDLMEARVALGIFTTEQAQMAEVYGDNLDDAKLAFMGIKNEVAIGLMPILSDLFVKFKDFFVENRKDIVEFIQKGLKAATAALKIFGVVLGVVVASKIGAWAIAGTKALGILAAAFTTAGREAIWAHAKIFAIPIAIGAAVAGLALIAEDLYQFFTGGESLTGELIQKFPKLKKVVDGLIPTFKGMQNVAKQWGNIAKNSFNVVVSAAENLWQGIKSIASLIATDEEWANFGKELLVSVQDVIKGFKWLTTEVEKATKLLNEMSWDDFFRGAENIANHWKVVMQDMRNEMSWDDFFKGAENIANHWKGVMQDMWTGLVKWMTDELDGLLDPIINVANKIPGVNINNSTERKRISTPLDIERFQNDPLSVPTLTPQAQTGSTQISNQTSQNQNVVVNVTNNNSGIMSAKEVEKLSVNAVSKHIKSAAQLSAAEATANGI